MFENQAKGWHGSYSTVGRNSAEKYPMILIKDKILNGQVEKKQIKDYFTTDDDLEANKIIIDDGEDIFSNSSMKKKKIKNKFNEICHHQIKGKIPEEYKYHQMHHKELHDYNLKLKKQKYGAGSNMLVPKKDITWRRTVTGPQWNCITGRDNNSIYRRTAENTSPNFYIDHNTFKNESKTFQMDKQTKRGQLPTSYDLRIRFDEPFSKDDNKQSSNKNTLTESETGDLSKTEKSKTLTKRRDNMRDNHSINFAKNLSRDQYNFLHRDRRGVRPFFNPNYNLVEERSLSMVRYNQKMKFKPKIKRMKGLESNLFFEPYKCMDKVNNHKLSYVPNLRTMVGRENNANAKDNILTLPGYMLQIYDRNSLDFITEKGLKMNNFVNLDFAKDYTSFCNKKSYNAIINHNLLKGSKKEKNPILDGITKNMNTQQRIKKLMEFYTTNLDNQDIGSYSKKFDGVTFKTVDKTVELSEKEKKLFSLKFD